MSMQAKELQLSQIQAPTTLSAATYTYNHAGVDTTRIIRNILHKYSNYMFQGGLNISKIVIHHYCIIFGRENASHDKLIAYV